MYATTIDDEMFCSISDTSHTAIIEFSFKYDSTDILDLYVQNKKDNLKIVAKLDWNSNLLNNQVNITNIDSQSTKIFYQLPKSYHPINRLFYLNVPPNESLQMVSAELRLKDINLTNKVFYRKNIVLMILLTIMVIYYMFFFFTKTSLRNKYFNNYRLDILFRMKNELVNSIDQDRSLTKSFKTLRSLQILEQLIQKEKIKTFLSSKIALMILYLILFFLLLGQFTANGQNPQNIIKDLKIEVNPSFDDNAGSASLMTSYKFRIETNEYCNADCLIGFQFESLDCTIGQDDIKANPKEVEVTIHPYDVGYYLPIKSPVARKISPSSFDLATNNPALFESIESNRNPILNKNEYIELKINFSGCAYADSSFMNLNVHKFPYDKISLKYPIKFNQLAYLIDIDVHKTRNYTCSFFSDVKSMTVVEGNNQYKLLLNDKSLPFPIETSKNLQLRIDFHRSIWLRLGLPLILLIAAIISGFAIGYTASLPEGRKASIAVELLGLVGGVPLLYNLVMNNYYKDIPDFLDFDGRLNFADIYFAFSYLLCVFISIKYCAKKKRKLYRK